MQESYHCMNMGDAIEPTSLPCITIFTPRLGIKSIETETDISELNIESLLALVFFRSRAVA